VDRNREGLGGRQAGVELVVDEEAPDIAVGDPSDEVFDVNAAVAQCSSVAIGLCDLGLERDNALKAGPNSGMCFSSNGYGAIKPDRGAGDAAGSREGDVRRVRTEFVVGSGHEPLDATA
jgi:hypothetical protein